ncbi:hypothetical protein ACUOCP_56435, partial [Escherichia sp. R-CC3]
RRDKATDYGKDHWDRLDPTYNYAHLNRGIALYYGGRDKLAQDDLLAFYQDDPAIQVRVVVSWIKLKYRIKRFIGSIK